MKTKINMKIKIQAIMRAKINMKSKIIMIIRIMKTKLNMK